MDYLTHGNDAYEASWAAQDRHEAAVDAAAETTAEHMDYLRQLDALRRHPACDGYDAEQIGELLYIAAEERENEDYGVTAKDILIAWFGKGAA